ncbi:carbon-nitrogen hydrolase family protein [Nakamurella deserti]|uniref:carbon-nitrogen hydrolase family protein n=1 Tax=Nakamurella deserti TaxID=2164074 RepID=UPI000DBE3C9F|nr:carbon-nitrogen hydrolase family protein [Nakamurella deserti]
MLRIAVGQFVPGSDPVANLDRIDGLAARAAAGGARLLVLPEGSLVEFIDDKGASTRCAEPLHGPFAAGLAAASSRHGLTVAAGSFVPVGDRVANTLIIAGGGDIVAAYRKIHLYDAFSFLESDTVARGDAAPPVVEIDGVPVGFATCYDLRFPELFRSLVSRGAQVLALPAAWVSGPLKEEHWLTLLRARAIENTCYVVGADQVGRRVIGRSAAFDPMGLPLLDLGTAKDAVGFVDVEPDRLAEVRAQLPSLTHRRFPVGERPA